MARTGGWSTGLRLACLWLKEQCETDRQGRGFTGSTRTVGDYFRDEVLSRQKPEVRRFLLRASVASPLSADLAGTLTGTADAARILDRLSRENCFVEAPDAGRPGYGFHPLFQEFLRAELGRESPDDVPRLLGEAARWHRSNGRPLDALRAAVAGEDWEHAVEILAEDDVRVLLGAEDGELSAILTRLPPELVSATPMVALAHAWTRLIAGDPDAAAPYIESAERAAGTVEPRIDRIIAALNLVRAWMSGGCTPESLSTARRALHRAGGVPPHAPAERRATGCLLLALGLAHCWNVEFVSAGTALRRAVKELEAGDFPALTCFATACAALVGAIQGDLTGAEETAGALRSDLARAREPAGTLRGPTPSPDGPLQPHTIADLALAWVHLERDEPADVHRLLERIEPWPRRRPPEDGPVSAFATLIRARALVAGGDVAAARSCLANSTGGAGCRLGSSRRWPSSTSPGFRRPTLPAFCPTWIPRPRPSRIRNPPPRGRLSTAASDAVAMGRLHLIRNDPWRLVAVQDCLGVRRARGAVADRSRAAGRRGRAPPPGSDVAGRRAAGSGPGAGGAASGTASVPRRRPIRQVAPDDSRAARRPPCPVQRRDPPTFRARSREPQQRRERPALTQCELAVLRFLPSHMTNKEIAEDLFLSVNTVKTHLRSVYRKLGVTTRREAISQATRQGFV